MLDGREVKAIRTEAGGQRQFTSENNILRNELDAPAADDNVYAGRMVEVRDKSTGDVLIPASPVTKQTVDSVPGGTVSATVLVSVLTFPLHPKIACLKEIVTLV